MPLNDASGNVEPQSGPLPDGLGGEERIENASRDVRGNAWPVVLHADYDFRVGRPGLQTDVSSWRCVDRVVDQVSSPP
jgi:hypothetical protein